MTASTASNQALNLTISYVGATVPCTVYQVITTPSSQATLSSNLCMGPSTVATLSPLIDDTQYTVSVAALNNYTVPGAMSMTSLSPYTNANTVWTGMSNDLFECILACEMFCLSAYWYYVNCFECILVCQMLCLSVY